MTVDKLTLDLGFPEVSRNADPQKHPVMVYLSSGRDAAVSMSYLAVVLHVRPREVRRMVEQARNDGFIIIGNDSGYYLPQTSEELRKYLSQQYQYLRSKKKALRAAEKAFLEGVLPSEGEDIDQ